MPLPEGGKADGDQQWPPRWMNPILDKIDEWAAWYSGDPAELHRAYGGNSEIAGDGWVRNRPSQFRGGIVGTIARAMWGPPVLDSDAAEHKLHIPIAGDIAAMSADTLYGEPPAITVKKGATQTALDALIDDGLFVKLREGAELQSATGGVFLAHAWDRNVHDRPWVNVYPAEVAVPEFAFGRLNAVTFWRVVRKAPDNTIWRHLERHETGLISHGLYEGTADRLGTKRPLTTLGSEYPELQDLAASLEEDETLETGIPRLTVEYIPNMLPNRIWRGIDGAGPIGRSDYSGIENAMASLDDVWTSWMRDIRLSRSRLIVPQTAVQSLGKGQGASFATDQEILLGLQLSLGADEDGITVVQFNIRVEEHERSVQALKEAIVRGAGFSIQAYSGTTEGTALTATEVAAHQQTSLVTRDKKIQYQIPAVAGTVQTHMMILKAKFGGSVDVERPQVEFPDGISESPEEISRYVQAMRAAKALSTYTAVQLSNPDWEDKQITEEVARIEGDDMAQKAAALSSIGDALTKIGTAVSLGQLSQADASGLVARVTGVEADVPTVQVAPSQAPNGKVPVKTP